MWLSEHDMRSAASRTVMCSFAFYEREFFAPTAVTGSSGSCLRRCIIDKGFMEDGPRNLCRFAHQARQECPRLLMIIFDSRRPRKANVSILAINDGPNVPLNRALVSAPFAAAR